MLLKSVVFLVIILITFFSLPKIVVWYFSIAIDKPEGSYDFIIVGGGTTGSVVANRLSEIMDVRVLVLEAGGEDPFNPFILTPLFASTLQKTSIDWHFVTESQRYSGGVLQEDKHFLPRGKILGGTSVINYLVYARGSRHDYDAWESLGATGWNYDAVLPYFIKSENAEVEHLKDSPVHGHDGYLKVNSEDPLEATKWFIEAGKDLGMKEIDYNAEDEGFGLLQKTAANAVRQTAADAYLYPFAGRKNLDIVTYAHVTRVLFEAGSDNLPRAVGVEYVKNGMTYTVTSKKEVILSAGALATPQLLMLSGVGPKNHLEEHKIKVVADLPGVGENLQDHTYVRIGFDYRSNATDGVSMLFVNPISFERIKNYALFGKGDFSSTGVNGFGFLKLDKDNSENRFDYPDMYTLLYPYKEEFSSEILQQKLIEICNIKPEIMKDLVNETNDINGEVRFGFSAFMGISHPKSTGNIRLASNDYRDYPLIDPKYFKDERDIEIYVKALRFWEKMEGTPTFKSRGVKMRIHSPLCEGNGDSPRTDEFYKCFLRSYIMSQYHQASTAKMGSSTDPMAVTSPRLRVYKVERLRVADASVMPQVTSANLQAPCYMIGEKTADMIKEDWKLN